MTLRECLEQVPPGILRKMAAAYGLSYVGEVPADLARSLAGYLSQPDNLAGILENLSPVERLALEFLLLTHEGGLHRIRCHRQLRAHEGLSHDEGQEHYVTLMEKGLAFQGRRGWEELYFVPSDLRPRLRSWALARLAHAAKLSQTTVEAQELPGDLLVRQALWFLQHCRKHSPRLTQKGRIYKRDQAGLYEAIGWPLPEVGDQLVTYEDRHVEPVEFLLSYFRKLEVIDDSGAELELGPELDSWLELKPDTKRSSMLEYLFDTYIQSSYLPMLLAGLKLAEGKWVDWQHLAEKFAHRAVIPEERSALQNLSGAAVEFFWRSALPLCASLGLVETGKTNQAEEETLAVRWAAHKKGSQPPESQGFYVQPTFEILVPLTARHEHLWGLGLLAELQKVDLMCSYHLEENTIYRALEWGLSPESVRSFLEEGARAPLPQNVQYSLDSWLDKYGKIHFVKGIVVECADEESAEFVQSIELSSGYTPRAVGARAFLIAADDHAELVNKLREAGQLPSTEIARVNPTEPKGRSEPVTFLESTASESNT